MRLAHVLRRISVRTGQLWQLALGWLAGLGVPAAWEAARSGFSLESAYRWRRRWWRAEPALRTWLCRGPAPPDDPVGAIAGIYGACDPIAVFQAREQRHWPGFGS